MKILFALIKSEFIKIKNNLLFYMLLIFIFPLLLYLFISIPLSLIFYDMQPVYVSWSSAGLFSVNIAFVTYILSQNYYEVKITSKYFFATPVTCYQNILANYLYLILIGVSQLIISIFIINSLNGDYMRILDFFVIILLIIPLIIFISNIGCLIILLVNNKNIFIDVFSFLILSFSFGAFIPLDNIHQSFASIAIYLPIGSTIANVQRIISSESMYFSLFLVSLLYAVFSFILILYMFEYKIKNKKT